MKNKQFNIKTFFIALMLCVFILPTSVFADFADNDSFKQLDIMYYTVSTDSLPANYTGNTTNLINVRNPLSDSVSTTTKSYAISAVAKSGVTVTAYAYNPVTTRYEKVYNEKNNLMQTTVGASNLYAQTISLKNGSNKFMLVAQKDGFVQTAKFEITLLNSSFKDKLKSLTIGLVDMFG